MNFGMILAEACTDLHQSVKTPGCKTGSVLNILLDTEMMICFNCLFLKKSASCEKKQPCVHDSGLYNTAEDRRTALLHLP